jgi:hypothetical protein
LFFIEIFDNSQLVLFTNLSFAKKKKKEFFWPLSYDLGYEDGHNWRCFSGVERVFIPFLWFMIFISTRWMFVRSNGSVKDSPKNAFCGF